MTSRQDDASLRNAFVPLRSLEPSDAEVARVLGRATRRPRSPRRRRVAAWRRLAPAALAALVLLAAGYATTDPVRAAIDGVAGTFKGWLGGDSSKAPGRPLGSGDQAPTYFSDPRFASDPRVIAEADGWKLYAAREPGGTLTFDLGDSGYGVGNISADSFGSRPLQFLGPGAVKNQDEHGHVPLFGITARSVKRVELTYESGPPLRVDGVDGGFVLLAEPARRPHAILASDARGREVDREAVGDVDWSQYGPPAPRVPSRCQPGAAGNNPPAGCPTTAP